MISERIVDFNAIQINLKIRSKGEILTAMAARVSSFLRRGGGMQSGARDSKTDAPEGKVGGAVGQMQKNGAVLAGKGQPEGEWRGEDEGGLCDAREQESTGRQRGYVGRVRSVRPRDRLGRELLPGGR